MITALPVTDLNLPKAGAWNGYVKWKKSGLYTFQGESVVRATYKKGSGTSKHDDPDSSGMIIAGSPRGIEGARAAVFAFDIYFDPSAWEWSRGGKVGGIFVGEGKASGGNKSSDGASHRLMWKTDADAISYVYVPEGVKQPSPLLQPDPKHPDFGIDVFREKFRGALKKGQWNRIEIGVKVNTFQSGKPVANGVASMTINGVNGTVPNVIWSRDPGNLIEKVDINTFFGGPDPATVNSVAYLKNFGVFEWVD